MSDRYTSDDTHLIIATDVGNGDEISLTWRKDYYDGEAILDVEIDEPWAGDTETGFGRTCDVSMSLADAERLLDWLARGIALAKAGRVG